MRFAIITDQGIEKTSVLESKELLGVDSEIKTSFVEFDLDYNDKNMEDLFKFIILTQSSRKLVSVISSFEFKDEHDLLKNITTSINSEEMKFWITKEDLSFHVRSEHHNVEMSSIALEPKIGELILEKYKDLKVKLTSSDLKFILFISGNNAVFGVDITLDDLSKRDYKLMNSGKSIKATIAYHMLRSIDYKKEDIIVDPNSKTAEIVIEAALFLTKMMNYYETKFPCQNLKLFQDIDTDKLLKNIKYEAKKTLSDFKGKNIYAYSVLLKDLISGKKNAKIAGILDLIEFSRVDMDWLDTKFEKHSVDKIITILPSHSKHVDAKQVIKIYKELFYQAEYILKDNGKLGILIQKPEDIEETIIQKNFKIINDDKIMVGELELHYIIVEQNDAN